jgi:hypothetical protein
MLACVDQPDDFDRVRRYPIDQYVVWMDHPLPGAGRASGSIHEWMLLQTFRASLDGLTKPLCSSIVPISDVFESLAIVRAATCAPMSVSMPFCVASLAR